MNVTTFSAAQPDLRIDHTVLRSTTVAGRSNTLTKTQGA